VDGLTQVVLDPPGDAPRVAPGRRSRIGPQGLVIIVAAVAGARLGLRPISDNSELVHLRTGIDLVRTGHVPRSDPYSYTAPGHPWVVQSWLASLTYGVANAIGHHALVVEQALLMAGVAAVVALTARSTTAWRSGVAATLAIAASAPGWSPRPLLFELLCLALVILVVERRAHPGWLVPVMWVWVNTHGSWPVGLAWLVARGVGEVIDVRRLPRQTIRYVGGLAAGLVASMANPLTWRLLAFPLVVFAKERTFQNIVEWRSPNFQDPNSFIALVFIVLSFAVLFRSSLPWAHVLPVCGFLAAGLVAERNLAPLGIVLAPALALALAQAPTPAGSTQLGRAVAAMHDLGATTAWQAACVAVAGIVTAGLVVLAVGKPTLNLTSYPVAATTWLADNGRLGPGHRIASVDVVGCYLIWRAGPATKVFIDDRYDMYPKSVVDDANAIGGGGPGAESVLDRRGVDTVLWSSAGVLPGQLLSGGGWRQTYNDGTWDVLVRDPTTQPGTAGA
jgi:hypothetical protein